jgi:hypothetical protein
MFSKRQPAQGIIVLGMHRSGTSCLAGSLQSFGVNFGEVTMPTPFNRKGHIETVATQRVNNNLLKGGGGCWRNPVIISKAPLALAIRMKLIIYCLSRNKTPWGIKDPRMLFCLEAWPISECSFLGTFRHPLKVAESLEKRSLSWGKRRGLQYWISLWEKYNLRLLETYRKNPFPLIDFDWEQERYLSFLRNFQTLFGLSEANEDFFSDHLRSSVPNIRIANTRIAKIYQELKKCSLIEEKRLSQSVR